MVPHSGVKRFKLSGQADDTNLKLIMLILRKQAAVGCDLACDLSQ